MTEIRENCYYSDTHIWVNIQDNIATCGMSDYGQAESGELVFVELPELGRQYQYGDEVCVIESVKSASDLYSPLSGKILEINKQLESTPNLINTESYDDGWIFKISIDRPQEVNDLLSVEDYAKLVGYG